MPTKMRWKSKMTLDKFFTYFFSSKQKTNIFQKHVIKAEQG